MVELADLWNWNPVLNPIGYSENVLGLLGGFLGGTTSTIENPLSSAASSFGEGASNIQLGTGDSAIKIGLVPLLIGAAILYKKL